MVEPGEKKLGEEAERHLPLRVLPRLLVEGEALGEVLFRLTRDRMKTLNQWASQQNLQRQATARLTQLHVDMYTGIHSPHLNL